MSTTSRPAASRFATVMTAMTMPMRTRSQVFCRSMRPGSPAISTTGITHTGWTRYRAGRATCRPTTAMIATATGHQCSPRSAAGASSITGPRGGFRSAGILHDDPGIDLTGPDRETRRGLRPVASPDPGGPRLRQHDHDPDRPPGPRLAGPAYRRGPARPVRAVLEPRQPLSGQVAELLWGLDQRFPGPTRSRRLLAVIGTCQPMAIRNCPETGNSVTDC